MSKLDFGWQNTESAVGFVSRFDFLLFWEGGKEGLGLGYLGIGNCEWVRALECGLVSSLPFATNGRVLGSFPLFLTLFLTCQHAA